MSLLDKIDVAPGWKSASLGLLAALAPFLRDLFAYLGLPPIPDDLMRSGQALLAAAIGAAMVLKARRKE
jgi:hypothetical protein